MSQSTLHQGNAGFRLKTRLVSWSVATLRASQRWLQALDQILRGETTHPSALRGQSLRIPVAGLAVLIMGLALSYGFCMGMYPGCRIEDPSGLLWLACTLKIPALFLLTLCVTFPSLYVVNALVGSRLRLLALLQLLVAALGVNLAVLASAGPIVAFFSFSTTNHHFMVLLNVLVFTVSGLLGMAFLLQTLHRLSTIPGAAAPRPQPGPVPMGKGEQSEAMPMPSFNWPDQPPLATGAGEKSEAIPGGPSGSGETGTTDEPGETGPRPGVRRRCRSRGCRTAG